MLLRPLSDARAQAAEALDKARSTLGDGIQLASDKARATLGDGMETASNTYDETADSVSSTYSTAATTVSDYSQHALKLARGRHAAVSRRSEDGCSLDYGHLRLGKRSQPSEHQL